jgi:hypothetical protein
MKSDEHEFYYYRAADHACGRHVNFRRYVCHFPFGERLDSAINVGWRIFSTGALKPLYGVAL